MPWTSPMIKAVLLDLDDTLLGNPTEAFVHAYMAALNRSLCGQLGVEDVLQPVLTATRAVMMSQDPLRTNEETFYDALVPLLSTSLDPFRSAAEVFYQTVYPTLQAGTQRRHAARPLVETLAGRGITVVVATNPFFPRVAVEQRLDWAGLPVRDMPFALVTTLENMHFSKPHPDYYGEILARIGVLPGDALMAGDDWPNDIVPAHQAGLHTFWIAAEDAVPGPGVRLAGRGSLDDFFALVQREGWLDSLVALPVEPGQILPRLQGSLAALWGMAQKFALDTWARRAAPGEWSPAEVIWHLAETERRIHRPRLARIVREENPVLQPVEEPLDARLLDDRQVALIFARERQATIDFLAALDDEAWSRPAVHPQHGAITLLDLVDLMIQHDQARLLQLRETVSYTMPG